VLLFTTLFTGFVFAADATEWEVADDITINVKAHVQTFGDQSYTGKGQVAFGTEGKAKRLEKFDVTLEMVENIRAGLYDARKLAKEIDYLTYAENKVTGFENHLYQISCSDFNSNAEFFKKQLAEKICEIQNRKPCSKRLRLGLLGVPPMTCDIYDFVEKFDSRFVYSEVQREFSFPRGFEKENIFEQYYDYTYPYDIGFRLEEIIKQTENRKIDGIIHYTQAFCHRQIEDIVIKKELNIPVLNIEGDKLNTLDARTQLRIEAFLDMLSDFKSVKASYSSKEVSV
jgi:benzoyl-CoA reductase/2-hydroxyglutaryl-CoA dehydratase subunit BcrC/BadD/HgdB